MNKYDLEHILLKGGVLYLGDIPTYKVTLGEMADRGFNRMQNVISILTMDDSKSAEFLDLETPSTFKFIVSSVLQEYQNFDISTNQPSDDMMCVAIPTFLSLVFKRHVRFNINGEVGFIIEYDNDQSFLLGENNFDAFRTILKERNCLINIDDVDDIDNPVNEMAKKLLEKRKMLREKVAKAKKATIDEDGLNMADLISIFAEAEKMPLQDIYEKYDMYQFNNQFNRLKIMDDFHVNIQALLAGAKKEDVNLQHWLSKIKKPEN